MRAGKRQWEAKGAGKEADSGQEGDQAGGGSEVPGAGGGGKGKADQGAEPRPDRAEVDRRAEAGDDADVLEAADAVGDRMRAEAGDPAKLRVRRPSIPNERTEDLSVDAVDDIRFRSHVS